MKFYSTYFIVLNQVILLWIQKLFVGFYILLSWKIYYKCRDVFALVDTLEFGLKILFFILSIIWMGKIMILRTDKQIVINPLLIGISAVLVMLHTSQSNIEFFGLDVQYIRIVLYIIYSLIILIGIWATNRRNGIF